MLWEGGGEDHFAFFLIDDLRFFVIGCDCTYLCVMEPLARQQRRAGRFEATRVLDADPCVAIASAMPGGVEVDDSLAFGMPYSCLDDAYARYHWCAYWDYVESLDGFAESLNVLQG